jgi:hypothetical protein
MLAFCICSARCWGNSGARMSDLDNLGTSGLLPIGSPEVSAGMAGCSIVARVCVELKCS